MSAFLVMIVLFAGPNGVFPMVHKVPYKDMAACEAFMADPAEIEVDFDQFLAQGFKVVGMQAGCAARQDGKPV